MTATHDVQSSTNGPRLHHPDDAAVDKRRGWIWLGEQTARPWHRNSSTVKPPLGRFGRPHRSAFASSHQGGPRAKREFAN
jgi:hypothetical protein